ncbi:MAG TPA: hypothetical protein VGR19_01105 [Allosphingosinicella sp.]|nr:hypothetical protein [Allosphingosinicella sp.]
MDIDDVLGSFELPSDRPPWEAALLAKLSDPEPMSSDFQEQSRQVEPQPIRTRVILPFTRPAAA